MTTIGEGAFANCTNLALTALPAGVTTIGEDAFMGCTNLATLSFGDAFDVSEYAAAALQWACSEGIVTGKPGGLLDPQGVATRAEVAAMLHRFCETMK